VSEVTRFRSLRGPAIISSVIVLPLLILELVNRRAVREGFPFPLFGLLWLLPLFILLILRPCLRSLKAEPSTSASRFGCLAGIALCILVGRLWLGIVLDQLPCFLGVPRCD